ncbi:MAG: DegT/DnrJ/EryC1/StrS family aminotransferase, partial [Planctomycetes bacterium]|nr:DegT/DnrJ/EryC1/StrS family aminotransferase [Planctomycetota bacterium]
MPKLAIRGGKPLRARKWPEWPVYDRSEERALLRVLRSRNWGGYPEPNTEATAFAAEFARAHGARFGICCANGTVTLKVAFRALGLRPGDEYVTTPYTFAATAVAGLECGLSPVFADVDPETYCLDPKQVEKAITRKTRAIVPVHLACSMADMDAIMEIARRRRLFVVEDCAHAHGGKWREKCAGAIGDFGSFSMQSSKLVTAGEGGVLLTSDAALAGRAHSLVNCGRREPQYGPIEAPMIGYNYRITEWSAAVLRCQLSRLAKQNAHREKMMAALEAAVADVPGIRPLSRDPRHTVRHGYQFILRYDPARFGGLHRDRFVEALEAEGIPCDGEFYSSLYRHPLYNVKDPTHPASRMRLGLRRHPCPHADRAGWREA